jgi:predicted amidohydrolase YtcJ
LSATGSSTAGRSCVPPEALLALPVEVPSALQRLTAPGGASPLLQNVHAIGDRANTVVLDAFAPHLSPSADRRLRIEHAQLLTPADLDRIVDLRVIASYQPTHATSDMSYVLAKLGPDRMNRRGNYAWRSVLDGGGKIALGSDFPIESVDPLKGFYAAVTRLDERGQSPHGPGGWFPAERLTRAQALKGMTLDTAHAAFAEQHTGSLEPGKRADFVVWDRDIMTCPPAEILKAKVLVTVRTPALFTLERTVG